MSYYIFRSKFTKYHRTTILFLKMEDDSYNVGYSKCDEKYDVFNKKIGRKLAYSRAENKPLFNFVPRNKYEIIKFGNILVEFVAASDINVLINDGFSWIKEFGTNNIDIKFILSKQTNTIEEDYFKCECNSRDHLLICEFEKDEKPFPNVIFNFTLNYGSRFKGFQKFKWRLKMAIKFIVFGYISVEDCWVPKIGELPKFIKWLNEKNKIINKSYKK